MTEHQIQSTGAEMNAIARLRSDRQILKHLGPWTPPKITAKWHHGRGKLVLRGVDESKTKRSRQFRWCVLRYWQKQERES